jgi:hypothetical protein
VSQTNARAAGTAAQREHEQQLRRRFVDDIAGVMRSPGGRRVVFWLLDRAGLYRTTFRPSAEDE